MTDLADLGPDPSRLEGAGITRTLNVNLATGTSYRVDWSVSGGPVVGSSGGTSGSTSLIFDPTKAAYPIAFTPDDNGTYILTATVTDAGTGLVYTDAISIVVANAPPTAKPSSGPARRSKLSPSRWPRMQAIRAGPTRRA